MLPWLHQPNNGISTGIENESLAYFNEQSALSNLSRQLAAPLNLSDNVS